MRTGCGLLAAAMLLLAASSRAATDYPSKPVNLVIGFAAGGETDIVVRAMNEELGKRLGVPAVVLNKPGSGGLVGAEFVAKSKPDGYNLLVLSLSHILRQAGDPGMPVNVLKDFEPVARYVSQPIVLVVKGDSQFKTLESLIDFGRKNPSKLNFGSPGVGSVGHFSGELFKAETKVTYKHVPFAGSAPSITALMGGHIDLLITALPAVLGKVASGDLRILASFADARLPEMKDVPTLREKGYAQALISGWFGFVAPAGTPREVLDKLGQAMRATIKDPKLGEIVQKMTFNEAYLPAAELAEHMRSELARFSKIARDEGIVIK
jgi:tripartite-type tricarboxylate transporter receptor subunit TctC